MPDYVLVLPWWYWPAVAAVCVVSASIVWLIVVAPVWLRVLELRRRNRR